MLSGATTTRLPSLRSMTTRPPPRVSMRSPGVSTNPAVSNSGDAPGLAITAMPSTLAARATTAPVCAFRESADQSAIASTLPHETFTPVLLPLLIHLPGRPIHAIDNARSAAGWYAGRDQGRQRHGGGSTRSLLMLIASSDVRVPPSWDGPPGCGAPAAQPAAWCVS